MRGRTFLRVRYVLSRSQPDDRLTVLHHTHTPHSLSLFPSDFIAGSMSHVVSDPSSCASSQTCSVIFRTRLTVRSSPSSSLLTSSASVGSWSFGDGTVLDASDHVPTLVENNVRPSRPSAPFRRARGSRPTPTSRRYSSTRRMRTCFHTNTSSRRRRPLATRARWARSAARST